LFYAHSPAHCWATHRGPPTDKNPAAPNNSGAITFTQFDFPGASITAVSGINDPGQIVGAYIDAGGAQHGFLLDDGVFTTIDFPGSALSTEASDIDNHGQIVGAYVDAAGVSHGFLRERNGTFTTIDVRGATVTVLNGINDRGQMVGAYVDAGGEAQAPSVEPSPPPSTTTARSWRSPSMVYEDAHSC
jgi:probable HAF family extracellular repeat protein